MVSERTGWGFWNSKGFISFSEAYGLYQGLAGPGLLVWGFPGYEFVNLRCRV